MSLVIRPPQIRAAELRLVAQLQSKVTTPNGRGGGAVSWTTDRTFRCAIRALTGAQLINAQRQQSTVTHVIHARYASDLAPAKRVMHNGTIYNIEAAWDPDKRQRFTIMHVSEGLAT